MRLRVTIFIFYFIDGRAGGLTLALTMKVIGLAAIMLEIVTSHCLTSWNHLET